MIGRLRHRDDFKALRRDGWTVCRGPIRVVFRPAKKPLAGVRVAFAIGREVGNAVLRNRTRRRLRAIMNGLAAQEGVLPPGDYLVRVNQTGSEVDSSKLREDIAMAIQDLQLRQKVGP